MILMGVLFGYLFTATTYGVRVNFSGHNASNNVGHPFDLNNNIRFKRFLLCFKLSAHTSTCYCLARPKKRKKNGCKQNGRLRIIFDLCVRNYKIALNCKTQNQKKKKITLRPGHCGSFILNVVTDATFTLTTRCHCVECVATPVCGHTKTWRLRRNALPCVKFRNSCFVFLSQTVTHKRLK